VLRRPVEFALHTTVGVVDESVEADVAAVPDRHLQGVQGEVGAQRTGGLPADDESAEHVDDERDVHPPGVGLDVGEIGDPQPVGGLRREAPLHEVSGPFGMLITQGGARRLASDGAT
jgi:hypothetical protein